MERSTVDRCHDGALNLFNTSFGSILSSCESEQEALKQKFIADLDAKIRAGDLKSDEAVDAYLSGFPELAAKAPKLKQDIKRAVVYDEIIRGTKRVQEYKAAVQKKQNLEQKVENAPELTKEEENLAKLARFDEMEKTELNKKIKELRQKEKEDETKPEEERRPLTDEEKDLKEYLEIQKFQKYSDDYADDIEKRSEKAGPSKHDHWNTLEEANEDFNRMKELYEGNYENEAHELNKPKEEPAKEDDGPVNKDKPSFEAKKEPELDDPETIDWAKFRERVIWKNLDNVLKGGNLADMGFALFTTLFIDMAADAIDELVKQSKEIKKANDKKKKDARNNTIEANLKDNGLTKTTFYRKLAVEAKNWILDTSEAEKIKASNPKNLSKREKFLLKKAEFVYGLPKTAEGDVDFRKFSRKQQKQYDEYLTLYANSSKWLKKSDQLMGVRVTGKEQAEIIAMARESRPQGGLEHRVRDRQEPVKEAAPTPIKKGPAIETVRVTKIDKDIDKLVDKVATGEVLTSSEQKKLGTVLADRGVSKQGIKDVQTIFADQAKGATDKDGKKIKPSEEMRQSILQVMVKGGLDDYVVSETMSKKKLTETDQAKIALQVDRQAKKKKALAEKMQALASKDQALARAREQLQQTTSNVQNRAREGRS